MRMRRRKVLKRDIENWPAAILMLHRNLLSIVRWIDHSWSPCLTILKHSLRRTMSLCSKDLSLCWIRSGQSNWGDEDGRLSGFDKSSLLWLLQPHYCCYQWESRNVYIRCQLKGTKRCPGLIRAPFCHSAVIGGRVGMLIPHDATCAQLKA